RTKLWKDHALIVINEAVLWSYENDGVRITDHHAAADSFVRFYEREENAGRSVSAEWSWIVPPISGAATAVYHRDFRMEPEFPNFLHQVPAWQTDRGEQILLSTSTIS
ncbi:MAG: nitric oxide synthase oxygenase, partial [Cyanobacteria bacterium P01_H01_bin.15]